MRLLLDTHVALWAIADDPKLSRTARQMIGDLGNDVFVSVATLWEIAIKFARARGGPNDMPLGSRDAQAYFAQAGYSILAISPAHVHAMAELPGIHSDPFDRMLLAQAYEGPFRFLTHDRLLPRYGDYVQEV